MTYIITIQTAGDSESYDRALIDALRVTANIMEEGLREAGVMRMTVFGGAKVFVEVEAIPDLQDDDAAEPGESVLV